MKSTNNMQEKGLKDTFLKALCAYHSVNILLEKGKVQPFPMVIYMSAWGEYLNLNTIKSR